MPSIPPEKALELYMKEMNKPERKAMMGGTQMTEANKRFLADAYKQYDNAFKDLERKYLSKGEHVPLILNDIFECARKDCFAGSVKHDWGARPAFHDTLPELIARLAFLFSLQRSNLIDSDGKTVLEQGKLGAVRPHCIQVLGLLGLLGGQERSDISSQIAEVLTGQGKSWVLLLLASVFAVTGESAYH